MFPMSDLAKGDSSYTAPLSKSYTFTKNNLMIYEMCDNVFPTPTLKHTGLIHIFAYCLMMKMMMTHICSISEAAYHPAAAFKS